MPAWKWELYLLPAWVWAARASSLCQHRAGAGPQTVLQTGSYIVWVIQSLCQHRAPSIGWSADRSSKICITGRSKATFEIAINSHILNTVHVNELWVENIDMSKPCHKIHLGTVDEQIIHWVSRENLVHISWVEYVEYGVNWLGCQLQWFCPLVMRAYLDNFAIWCWNCRNSAQQW